MSLTFDKDGKPIQAHLYDFEDPDLGPRQFTCLHALETKNGEVLGHDPIEIAEPREQREKKIVQRAEILEATTTVIGTTAIAHEVKVARPDAQEVAASIAARKDGTIPISDACDILGISPVSYRSLMTEFGQNPKIPIRPEDFMALLSLRPQLRSKELPSEGYVPANKLPLRLIEKMKEMDLPRKPRLRAFTLISFAREHEELGIYPQRMIDPETGKTGWYLSEKSVDRIVETYIREGNTTYRR
jgi:hypothetical protein